MAKKHKPANKYTILDHMKENQDPLAKQTMIAQSNIHAFKYSEEYANAVANYNKNVTTLDPDYVNVIPTHDILVRCFLHEPEKFGEVIMPYKQLVPVPTKSGVGSYEELESDFPYRMKAIIVSAPESNSLKSGDIVVLSRKAIQMNVIGNGPNRQIMVDQGFVHPDSNLQELPTDPTSKHYGYCMVSYFEVKAKLKSNE